MRFAKISFLFYWVTLAALSASAQEIRNGTAFGDWLLVCEATGVNKTECALRQTLSFRETSEFLADVTIRKVTSQDGPRTVVILNTPTGVFLPLAPGMAVDAASETLGLEWRSCDAQVCTAIRIMSEAEIAALREGAQLRIGYRPLNQEEPVLFAVSLDGITAGLAALQE